MKSRTYRMLYHGVSLIIAAGLFIGSMVFLSTVFNIDILGNLTLLFNEPTEYGEWEVVEEIDGIEHVYSSANGDNPKEVLSPLSYWIGFRGGMAVILVFFAVIFAYLVGHAIVSAILRMKDRTQTFITEARNHTLGDHITGTFDEYVDRCKEEMEANRSNPDRGVYIFGKKFEKGDRKSIIRLIIFLMLIVAVILYFVLLSIL